MLTNKINLQPLPEPVGLARGEFKCPNCGHASDLAEVLTAESNARLQQMQAHEVGRIEARVRAELEAKARLEITDLKATIEGNNKRLREFEVEELNLRKTSRELLEKERLLELESQRLLDRQRNQLEQELTARLSAEMNLKVAEKDQQLDAMRRQIDDLKRKASEGSSRIRGEVLEVTVEAALREAFPVDEVEDVPKGVRGADVVQRVRSSNGQIAGTIIWETKRTANWSEAWIDKLKANQRDVNAEFAVLVTQTLPKGVERLRFIDGVWVTDYETYADLAVALRQTIVGVHQARLAAASRGCTKDALYGYVTGTAFVQRVQTLVEALCAMREDLERERRTMQKFWSSREQQIRRAEGAMIAVYGECRGLVGNSLPVLTALELPEAT